MDIRQCPVCNNEKIEKVYRAERFPYIGFSVSRDEKRSILARYSKAELTSTLKIMSCSSCRHVFQSVKPNQELMNVIYGECYNYPSPMLSGFAQEREKMFLDFFFKNVDRICQERRLKNVLEIGCFDGFILYNLANKSFNVCGCDPSKGADIASSFGMEIYKRYFDSKFFIDNKKSFDIIIFRHFIEHVQQPFDLLEDVKEILRDDGVIIIETPNVEYYLENGSFETFGFQHLQNFSIFSLKSLLKKTSLNLIDHKITPENLIVVVSRVGDECSISDDHRTKSVQQFKGNLQRQVKSLRGYLKPFIEQRKEIVLWGAGGFCGYFFPLYGFDESAISYVVDIDQRKWDMCFMDKNLKIYPPKRLLSNTPDLIVITSMYSNEIIGQIRKMGIQSDVVSLHPQTNYIGRESLLLS